MNPGGNIRNDLTYIIILVLEIITGILMNVFIISVVCRDFFRTKSLTSSYKILACLTGCNVCFGVLLLVGLLDYFCRLGIFIVVSTAYIYLYLVLLTISSCAWFSANLGFFYLVKISNFESLYFSWMKKNIGSIVPWMLFVDLLLSLINSALSSLFFIFSPELSCNTTQISPSMISTLSQSSVAFINSAITNTSLPFLVTFITTLSTLVELKKHGNTMKNVQTSDSQRLRSYEKVVRRMTQSLFFYGIFYAVMIILCFTVITQLESGFWLLLLVLNSFTPVQSVLLVLANPKLRVTWKGIFLCGYLRQIATTGK
ncbi:taste receptor type 2 member 143-like [Mantella aurantiaca]